MFQKKGFYIFASLFFALNGAPTAYSFDLEDYATTYRASRDDYIKASASLQSAETVYKASVKARFSMEKAAWTLELAQVNSNSSDYEPEDLAKVLTNIRLELEKIETMELEFNNLK